MKTSVFEVHDMLSILAVDEVEQRLCAVPGVESATVNYAAASSIRLPWIEMTTLTFWKECDENKRH